MTTLPAQRPHPLAHLPIEVQIAMGTAVCRAIVEELELLRAKGREALYDLDVAGEPDQGKRAHPPQNTRKRRGLEPLGAHARYGASE